MLAFFLIFVTLHKALTASEVTFMFKARKKEKYSQELPQKASYLSLARTWHSTLAAKKAPEM